MKGLKAIVNATKNISCRDKSTWVHLYYNIKTDTVYMKEGEDRFYITALINPQTENDVKMAIQRCLNS